MTDIFNKCEAFLAKPGMVHDDDKELAADLFCGTSPAANAGPWIGSNGQTLLQFGTNDYLGLAAEPELRRLAASSAEQLGIGAPMGSRLLTGTTVRHLELERNVARFKRCEAAVTFSSGALAMIGSLACLGGRGDVMILDARAHATLVMGAKVSGAQVIFFRHNDLDHLQSILKSIPQEAPRAIVVDGVYSMEGDLAPLPELVALKKEYDARLIVDDAHGTGVLGPNGRGTAAHFDVEAEVDLHAGTFSKAAGTLGGFVAGNASVIEFIRYRAPTFAFTKAMPAAVVEPTILALQLLEAADDRRERLWENTYRLQDGLRESGFDVGETESPITPIRCPPREALHVAQQLRTSFGIWVTPVIYPAVPLDGSLLRVIPTAMHTAENVDRLVHTLVATKATAVLGVIGPNC